MQLDIETACSEEGGFGDPNRPDDRIIAIGERGQDIRRFPWILFRMIQRRLARVNEQIAEWDPDVVEGHNIFKFDLDTEDTSEPLKVPISWGALGSRLLFRKSRLRL